MRKDMHKVIVERPRRKGESGKKNPRYNNIENLPLHEGMTRPHRMHWSGKELNENLAPLYRFIHSRVGKRWDDVYSEICANIKVTSTVQDHIRIHLAQMVSTKIVIDENDEPWEKDGTPVKITDNRWIKYWVDPRDGILKYNKSETCGQYNRRIREGRDVEASTKTRTLDDGTELRKKDGIWYQVTLNRVPLPTVSTITKADGSTYQQVYSGLAWDVILEKNIECRYGQPRYYCATKRQISKKELKKYGLSNE